MSDIKLFHSITNRILFIGMVVLLITTEAATFLAMKGALDHGYRLAVIVVPGVLVMTFLPGMIAIKAYVSSADEVLLRKLLIAVSFSYAAIVLLVVSLGPHRYSSRVHEIGTFGAAGTRRGATI